MAEPIPAERLQPSLLDRLVDDEPDKSSESREKRVLSVDQLRASVLRDLTWLLNTSSLESCGVDLSEVPRVADSVLNFGVRDLAGATYSSVDPKVVETMVREAILRFEPRILPDTLEVHVLTAKAEQGHNSVVFEIHGTLWADPIQEQLFLKTLVDLETGDFRVETR